MSGPRISTRSTKTRGYAGIVNRTAVGWSMVYATPFGFVDMYATRINSGRSLTCLIFIHKGRRWERTIDAYYTPTGAARVATRFAYEIAQKGVQP